MTILTILFAYLVGLVISGIILRIIWLKQKAYYNSLGYYEKLEYLLEEFLPPFIHDYFYNKDEMNNAYLAIALLWPIVLFVALPIYFISLVVWRFIVKVVDIIMSIL